MDCKKERFLKTCMRKCQKVSRKVVPCVARDTCCQCSLWSAPDNEMVVPNDVPKGHLVVYVGEYNKRHVIKIKLLRHPLFKALLDQAQEIYDFSPNDSRLHIPCDENMFLSVVQCAKSPPEGCLHV
ncbi:auxin-induced protein 15A-like [Primulina eburnea]|uniref:auxin-induced protein 15A-like n=1 Tax=Primulina eburnea TaxID=1245227 RepID=UPI003C6BE048